MSELKLPTRKFGQPPSDFIDDDDTTENIVDQFSSDRTDRSDSDKEKKNEESNEIIVVDDEEDESSDDSSDESSDDDGSVSLKSSNESVENLAWNSKVAAPRQEPPIGNRTVNIESDKDKEIDNRLTEERIDDESDSDDETFDEDEMELDSEEEEKAVARQYRSAYMNNYDFECFDLYYSSSDDEMEIDKTPTSSVEDCNALEEVPDAWSDSNEICGANALEEEEQQACEFFKQTQKNLKRWNNEPKNEKLANTYFDSVHDLLQLRPFKRLRRNPYLIEKESNVRLFDFSPLQSAYFTTHKQLAHLVHNSVPHHLQILVLHPKNKDLWYRVGRLAAEIGDWKNAEFAYRQLICVSKEKNKGLQAIALVHFISGDFLKCLDDIKELLNYNPTNIIASALISELSRLNGPWSKYVEEVLILHGFKRNSRDSQQMKQVLKRIEAFRERLKDQCSKCRKQLKSSSQHAIKMVLTAEDLLFSHFTKRLIGFHDQVKKNTDAFLVFKYPVDGNSVNKKAEKVNSPTVLQTAPAASEPPALPEITELAYLHKKGRMECNENLSVEEEIENIMKNLMNQIDINVNTELTEEPPMKKQRVNVQCQPDVYVRRSTRFVEETNDDPSNTSQQQTWDVKDCLRVDRNTDFVFPSPLQSQSDVNYLLPNNPSIDKLDENVEIPEFLNMLLNKNKCERGLNGYAGVVAKLLDYVQKQVQCHGYGLEVVDKIAFLALYHKLTDMSNIVEIQPTMNVEFFAAEIGSELALKKLNEYARSLTHQHLTNVDEFEQSVEPQGTVPVESSSDWIEKVEASNDSMMKSLVRMRQELRKSRPPKSTECKKSKYRMINYVSGLTDNLLLQATLQNLGHKKPLDLCVDEGTLILCQPDFLPYGLIAPDVQLLSSEERRFLCRYHWFRALKFRNSKTDEVQSAYLALEWKHLLIMMKILNYHNLMGCTEDLGVTREELEWTSERLVYLTHEIKGRNAFCMLITMKKENIQSVIDYFVKEHDYMTDTVESTLTYLAAVYRCYLSENDYEGMFSTILRMSKILLDHSMKSTSIIKQAFSFCLTQLDAHLNEFSSLSAFTIRKIAKLLSLFTDKSFYRTFASLWILCYRLTVIESKEPVAEFKEHFNQAKKVVNFLPTRGLMILQEGHEALAEKNCCMNDQGEFVRFYLRELNRVITLSAFEEALIDFGSGIAAVLEHNVECEIIQAVACLCSLSINSKKHHIESHTIGDPKPMEWSILKLILPFLVPKKDTTFR
ncbi:hypothetical protein M3Y98_00741100 [Aphelenchoides besseyi]|nr:hypothetical protein M3Y98_00741100 [Aphelenchoides besseyi]